MTLMNATFAWLLSLASPMLPGQLQPEPCSDVPGGQICLGDELPANTNRPQATGTTRATPEDDPIYNGF